MVWPLPLPSARRQWNQWTYGIVPGGNWGFGHHTFCMDNGDIIQIVSHWYDFQYGESDMGLAMICRMSPNGNERLSVDATRDGIEYGDRYQYYVFPVESIWWTGKGDIREWPMSDSWDQWLGATDGRIIYLFNSDYRIMYKFDPATLQIEHIAGVPYGTTPYVDSSVGTSARFGYTEGLSYKDGYVYWLELSWDTIRHFDIRRMSTSPPYAVDTVFSYKDPMGAPTDTGVNWNAWARTDNPTTGIPNAFNEDFLAYSSTVEATFYGNYYYMFANTTMTTISVAEFARIDMATGKKQVLLYGIEYSEALHPIRDMTSNLRSTPNGTLLSGNENNRIPGDGYVAYEGMISGAANAVIVDDKFISSADPITSYAGGDQVYGTTIIAIDIPKLLTAVEENGGRPIRHDRTNPFWDTIANGTASQDVYSFYAYANRRRHWEHNDGTRPTLSHVLWHGGLATGNPGTLWDGKVVYATSMVGFAFLGNDNNNGMAVKVLEPPTDGGSFKARVVFEGTHLKGYSPVSKLRREGPTEVVLS